MGGAYVRRHHDLQTRIIPTPSTYRSQTALLLGTPRNSSSTYGAPVPHTALSCKHIHISLLGSKEMPSCHYSVLSIPYALTTGAKWKLPWIRLGSLPFCANPVGSSPLLLDSAGFSRLHSLPKRFHSHACSGGIRSDGPLALRPSCLHSHSS